AIHRLPLDVLGPALARCRRYAAPVCRLPARRWLHHPERNLFDRRVFAGRLDDSVLLQCVEDGAQPEGTVTRSVGMGTVPGVGDLMPAAAPQLRDLAAYPLGKPGIRPPSSRGVSAGHAR